MIRQIGKYQIVERIGRGGMGMVFKARDPVLDRLVALKVISSDVDVTDELRARFFREAQACARLNHPNIVTIYDMGEDDGRLFIVMELLEGEELRHVIAQKKHLPLEERIAVMMQVCDGLHFAHERGIIHRDIKPGNILVLRNGLVKILDFGLAHVAASDATLTRTGLIVGTLLYISPEQARGRVDHRSDIFSVGAVFYELLAFRPPFGGSDPMQILERLRSEEPTPLAEIAPDVPPDLAVIIERALRKDPAERFASLGDMRAQLEQVQRRLAEEAEQRLRARVDARFADVRQAAAALAERLGEGAEPDVLPVVEDRMRVSALQAVDRELSERLARLEAQARRADAVAPVLERGLEHLAHGRLEEAIADLEAVLAELPAHPRAARELAEAHRQVAERERQGAEAETARAAMEEGRARAIAVQASQRAEALWREAESGAERAAALHAQAAYAEAIAAFAGATGLFRQAEDAAGESLREEEARRQEEARRREEEEARRREEEARRREVEEEEARRRDEERRRGEETRRQAEAAPRPAGSRPAATRPTRDVRPEATVPERRVPVVAIGVIAVAAVGLLGGAYYWSRQAPSTPVEVPVAPATAEAPAPGATTATPASPVAAEAPAAVAAKPPEPPAVTGPAPTAASPPASPPPEPAAAPTSPGRTPDPAAAPTSPGRTPDPAAAPTSPGRTPDPAAAPTSPGRTPDPAAAVARSVEPPGLPSPPAAQDSPAARPPEPRREGPPAREAKAVAPKAPEPKAATPAAPTAIEGGARKLLDELAAAKRAAEAAQASKLAPAQWLAADRAEREAHRALERREPDRAAAGLRSAAVAYGNAERTAKTVAQFTQARVERERDNRATAEQARREMTTARRSAEQAGAERHAARLLAAGQGHERAGGEALARQDYAAAVGAFQSAMTDYLNAEREARRAAEASRSEAGR